MNLLKKLGTWLGGPARLNSAPELRECTCIPPGANILERGASRKQCACKKACDKKACDKKECRCGATSHRSAMSHPGPDDDVPTFVTLLDVLPTGRPLRGNDDFDRPANLSEPSGCRARPALRDGAGGERQPGGITGEPGGPRDQDSACAIDPARNSVILPSSVSQVCDSAASKSGYGASYGSGDAGNAASSYSDSSSAGSYDLGSCGST